MKSVALSLTLTLPWMGALAGCASPEAENAAGQLASAIEPEAEVLPPPRPVATYPITAQCLAGAKDSTLVGSRVDGDELHCEYRLTCGTYAPRIASGITLQDTCVGALGSACSAVPDWTGGNLVVSYLARDRQTCPLTQGSFATAACDAGAPEVTVTCEDTRIGQPITGVCATQTPALSMDFGCKVTVSPAASNYLLVENGGGDTNPTQFSCDWVQRCTRAAVDRGFSTVLGSGGDVLSVTQCRAAIPMASAATCDERYLAPLVDDRRVTQWTQTWYPPTTIYDKLMGIGSYERVPNEWVRISLADLRAQLSASCTGLPTKLPASQQDICDAANPLAGQTMVPMACCTESAADYTPINGGIAYPTGSPPATTATKGRGKFFPR